MHPIHHHHLTADLTLIRAEHAERVARVRGDREARRLARTRRRERLARRANGVDTTGALGRAGPLRVRLAHGRNA